MDKYGQMVHDLFRKADTYELTPFQKDMLHAACGVGGEGCEVLDEVKKFCFTGKALSRNKLVKEMGDLEFYLEKMRQLIKITRDEVLAENMKKLTGKDGRYPSGHFSVADALSRQDTEKK